MSKTLEQIRKEIEKKLVEEEKDLDYTKGMVYGLQTALDILSRIAEKKEGE